MPETEEGRPLPFQRRLAADAGRGALRAVDDATTPVLLLPGLHGSGLLFSELVAAAPRGFAPQTLEYPGGSPLTPDELVALIRAQTPAAPWLVVAESFSGPLAILLAAARPPGLLGLVLAVTGASWPHLRWFSWLPLAAIFASSPPELLLRALLTGSRPPPGLVAATRRTTAAVRPQVMAHRFRTLARIDVSTELRGLALPVLYLTAEGDRVVTRGQQRRMREARPDLEAERLPGPHFLLQTHPAEAWARIAAFARRRCNAQSV